MAAFDDINRSTWKGIGVTSSLVLLILSIYMVMIAGWLVSRSEKPSQLNNIIDIIADPKYPPNYISYTYAWIVVAIILLIFHIIVLLGYAMNASLLLDLCKIAAISVIVVIAVLLYTFGSIIYHRTDYVRFQLSEGVEVSFLAIFFSATLVTEAVLTLALLLGSGADTNTTAPATANSDFG